MDAAETGDYEVTIANIGSGAVTVARAGTDTINGSATSLTLNQYSSVTLKVNSAGNGYNSISNNIVNNSNTFTGNNTFSGGNNTLSGNFNVTGNMYFYPPQSGGTTTAYTGTLGLSAYTVYQVLSIRINATNTTASTTINFDSLGAKTIKLLNGNDAYIGALKIGMIAKFLYDGTNMVLLNPEPTSLTFRGALVYLNATQSISTGTATAINFTNEEYDTDSIHDNATNNTRLTVPSGASKVRVSGNVLFENSSNAQKTVRIQYNGNNPDSINAGTYVQLYSEGVTRLQAVTPISSVSAGDYFELVVAHAVGSSINVGATSTWFCMEVIE
jgi:hypothetical protein